MIVLDTHIWVWWAHGDTRLSRTQEKAIQANETDIIGVSSISCWEIAKLVEYRRLKLPCPVGKWLREALRYPGVCLLDLTLEIAVESTQLPGKFHRDPVDQIIVATARIHRCPVATSDQKIIRYGHIKTIA